MGEKKEMDRGGRMVSEFTCIMASGILSTVSLLSKVHDPSLMNAFVGYDRLLASHLVSHVPESNGI